MQLTFSLCSKRRSSRHLIDPNGIDGGDDRFKGEKKKTYVCLFVIFFFGDKIKYQSILFVGILGQVQMADWWEKKSCNI